MLPVMIQLYNVRDELARDFEGTLLQVAGLGYKYVETAGLCGKKAEEFKAGLDKAGLAAVSAHVPYREMAADPEKVMRDYLGMGCKYIAIPYLAEEDRSTGPNYEEVKKTIRSLCEAAKKLGTVMLYHNHDFEFERYNGKYALDDLYDSIPPDLLQAEIDTCWVKVAGVDPAGYLRKYSGRVPVVHLKDYYLPEGVKGEQMYELIGIAKKAEGGGGFEFRSVGHGVQDIPSILRAAGEAGASWLVVEQDRPSAGKTPLECAKESIEYLNSLA
ncbi:MAG: sugar phosphate isomerase/epimerase [Treponema sp.]|jgi:sugar phosphate isomerase/epimerase|nr:sugar phosphate isomerase/epimerase [Treponema sp.]